MYWKNNWVILNAFGFSAGAASSLLILSATQWISSSVLFLISFLSFGLSIGIFQCVTFKSDKRLILRWLLASSLMSLLGFLVAASGFLVIFIILLIEFTSSLATFILFAVFGALAFALTGFLISNGQTIAARDHIHRARSWVWTSTVAFTAGGAILCSLFLLNALIIPNRIGFSLDIPLWGAISGLPSGAVFGLITQANFMDFSISIRASDEVNHK
jgi:hypothetical protein